MNQCVCVAYLESIRILCVSMCVCMCVCIDADVPCPKKINIG